MGCACIHYYAGAIVGCAHDDILLYQNVKQVRIWDHWDNL